MGRPARISQPATPDEIVKGTWTRTTTSNGIVTNNLNGEAYTVIKTSEIPNAGRGLFAARAFEKGEIIGFYGGNVTADTTGDISYTLTIKVNGNAEKIVDAKGIETHDPAKSRGDVHMANDSPEFSNAYFTVFGFMRALREIEKDEELYVSYGWEYWSEMLRMTDDLFVSVKVDTPETNVAFTDVFEGEPEASASYFETYK